jgi:hypothetical protein
MLKVGRSVDHGTPIFAISGRIEEARVPELRELLDSESDVAKVALDLEELRLVDRGAVRFLAACEARGVKLRNCRSYIREWIETGREI